MQRILLAAILLAFVLFLGACLGGKPVIKSNGSIQEDQVKSANQAHLELYLEDQYPSAKSCLPCHPRQYEEWAASPHAYAQLSPVFNSMQATIQKKLNGTLGDFCIRCHTPVGMAIDEPLFVSNTERHPTSVEGITCIGCHRVNQAFGKVSGRRALVSAGPSSKISGPSGPSELKRALADPDYHLKSTDSGTGRVVHQDVEKFFQLVEPGFCGSCHDVNLPNGFRLEEAFSEYKTSPAAEQNESCQDCHMGKVIGEAKGYDRGPAAIVGGKPTKTRKIANHTFVGPDYSIVHPALFPHNPEAQEMASMKDWLKFDVDAGWGKDAFEDEVTDETEFPDCWADADDRYEAREIIDDQLDRLEEVHQQRKELLAKGYLLGDIEIQKSNGDQLQFNVPVSNGTTGHNVPTGFTAERLVFLRVNVRDSQGELVFQSGHLDPNGDVLDGHSVYVHNGELPRDKQLFSLQSKFLTLNALGSEREQILAINYSVDPLPFLRPETFASTLTGRPGGSRIHKKSIEPGGTRNANYSVDLPSASGRYDIDVQLIAAMVPVNLISAIQEVGFDYNLSAREVARRIVAGHLVLHERKASVEVK